MLTREQFAQFKSLDATQELKAQAREIVEVAAAEIINRTEPNEPRDMYLRGFIRGVISTIEWEPEFADRELEQLETDGGLVFESNDETEEV